MGKIHNDDSGHLSLSHNNYFMLTFHVVDIQTFRLYNYSWYVNSIWYCEFDENYKVGNNAHKAEIKYNKNPNALYVV